MPCREPCCVKASCKQTAYANGSGSPCGNAAYLVLAGRRIASARPEAYQARLLSHVLKAIAEAQLLAEPKIRNFLEIRARKSIR